MANDIYFDPAGFRFLRDLAKNNNREWFNARKPRYQEKLRDPFLQLIADLAAPLAKISPHFRADPRPSGGSMFRIYRDTRFANDKSPYKTWLGARMFHERARQVHAPLFYVHIQPGRCFAGGGLWHPEGRDLKRIRDFLVDNPASWKKATRSKRFRERFGLGGESLVRPPGGYDPEPRADRRHQAQGLRRQHRVQRCRRDVAAPEAAAGRRVQGHRADGRLSVRGAGSGILTPRDS